MSPDTATAPAPSTPFVPTPSIAPDKRKHFSYAAIGAFLVTIVVMVFTSSVWSLGLTIVFYFTGHILIHGRVKRWHSILISMGVAVLASTLFWVGKEIYDCYKTNPTGFSTGDLQADALGVVVGLVLSFALIMVVFPEDDPEPITYIPAEEEKKTKTKSS